MTEHIGIRMQRARDEQPWWGISWHDIRRACGIEDGALSDGARHWLEYDITRRLVDRKD